MRFGPFGRKAWRGAVFEEATFALPVVLLVALGLVQGGLLAWGAHAATTAASYGARLAAVDQRDPAARALLEAARVGRALFPHGEPEVEVLGPGGLRGQAISVRVTLRVPNTREWLAPLVPGLPRGSLPVSGAASFRQEGW